MPRPSQKSEHLLVPPRDFGKVALEFSLQELSSSVIIHGPKVKGNTKKLRKTTKKWPKIGHFAGDIFSFANFEVM